MSSEPEKPTDQTPPDLGTVLKKPLTPAAERALVEAAERRAKAEAEIVKLKEAKTEEDGGPSGLEPTRYGDWERKGIAYDF